MEVYSKYLNQASQTYLRWTLEILSQEAGLKVGRKRFHFGAYTYSVGIVFFERNPKAKNFELGYFDKAFYTIGIWEGVLKLSEQFQKNLLRHELAHYLTYIEDPQAYSDETPHGPLFQQTCQRYGWGPEISQATADIQIMKQIENSLLDNDKDQRLYEKYQKLLDLSKSDNPHESQLALTKAQDFLLKHNLETNHQAENYYFHNEKKIYVHTIAKASKVKPYWTIFSGLLKYFHVRPIFNKGERQARLDIIGTPENITSATQVFEYVVLACEQQWKNYQKQSGAKGMLQKNIFMRGFHKGMASALEKHRKQFIASAMGEQLISFEKQLDYIVDYLFQLRQSSYTSGISWNSRGQDCFQQGYQAGLKENISGLDKQHYYLK